MVLEGGDDVVGFDRLAVMESHAFAQIEGPGLGIRRGVPTLGHVRVDLAIGFDLPQLVEGAAADRPHETIFIGRGIKRVGGRAMANAGAQMPAFFRSGGKGRLSG